MLLIMEQKKRWLTSTVQSRDNGKYDVKSVTEKDLETFFMNSAVLEQLDEQRPTLTDSHPFIVFVF